MTSSLRTRHPAKVAKEEKKMAKVIRRGPAKPNDPIYTTGPVIGGKRFYNPNWADNPPPPITPKKEKLEPKKGKKRPDDKY